jgi:hypothetical protein
MKNIFAIIVLASILTSCSRNPVNKLFDEMKKDDRVVAFTLPGWMVNKAFGFAMKDDEMPNEELNKLQSIAADLKKIRVCVNNKPNQQTRDAITKGIKGLDNQGYDVFALVKNETNSYSFHVQEKKDVIKGLLFQINTTDNVALIYLDSEISKSTFEKINFNFNKQSDKK